jgi:hypothetical protein
VIESEAGDHVTRVGVRVQATAPLAQQGKVAIEVGLAVAAHLIQRQIDQIERAEQPGEAGRPEGEVGLGRARPLAIQEPIEVAQRGDRALGTPRDPPAQRRVRARGDERRQVAADERRVAGEAGAGAVNCGPATGVSRFAWAVTRASGIRSRWTARAVRRSASGA